MVNVTAVVPQTTSSSAGIGVINQEGGGFRLELANTIVYGPTDILMLNTNADTTLQVLARSSNFRTSDPLPGSPGPATVVPEDQQFALPRFRDLAAGDLRPRNDSPTRDAGTTAAVDVGPVDLQGIARVQGRAVDIGAYEFDDSPETRLMASYKRVLRTKGRRRKARFRFTSSERSLTFQCRLRGGTRKQRRWQPCRSPRAYTVRVRKRPYTFQVRAIDGTGNRDRTPARVRFRVRPR